MQKNSENNKYEKKNKTQKELYNGRGRPLNTAGGRRAPHFTSSHPTLARSVARLPLSQQPGSPNAEEKSLYWDSYRSEQSGFNWQFAACYVLINTVQSASTLKTIWITDYVTDQSVHR